MLEAAQTVRPADPRARAEAFVGRTLDWVQPPQIHADHSASAGQACLCAGCQEPRVRRAASADGPVARDGDSPWRAAGTQRE